MSLEIPRLYDSHTHFLATGQVARGFSLFEISSAAAIAELPVHKSYFRGQWLVGFGWNENNWPGQKLPTRWDLDKVFPNFPVFLSRADGHSSWLNSKALEILGWLDQTVEQLPNPEGGIIVRDEKGHPSGVLKDAAHMAVFEKLPPFTTEQVRDFY